MGELFPVLAGVAIGFVVQFIASQRTRTVALIGLSIVAGFIASYISGELFLSWDFLLIDVPLVFIGALATSYLLTWQRSRQLPR